MENLAPSILIIASSLVWTWAMVRRLRSKPIVPPAGTPESVPLVALVLGGVWVAMSLTSQLAMLVRTETAEGAASPPTKSVQAGDDHKVRPDGAQNSELRLKNIRDNVYLSAGVAMLLAVAYSLGNKTKQENELPVLRAVSVGFLAFLASMMPVLMVLMALEKTGAGRTSHSLLTFMQSHKSASEIMWVGASAVVTAPLLEELVYRVIMQRAISQHFGSKAGIVVAALIFSLVHGWPNMLGLLPLALIIGYVFEQTNNYLAVVATHASFNMCMLVLTLISMKV